MEIKDPCVHCGKSTAFGSGRFVDRIGYDDGWACAECMTIDSDEEENNDELRLPHKKRF
tara:strand:- start:11645 stop:11821 length:177 start_codon:yes stop_codon:yes gene_type:complete